MKIVCKDDFLSGGGITEGKIYDTISEIDLGGTKWYFLINDDQNKLAHTSYNFIKLSLYRKQKLSKIL